MKNVAAGSVNKGCYSPQPLPPPRKVGTEGTQDRDKLMPTAKPLATATAPVVHPDRTQDRKEQDMALEDDVSMKGMVAVSPDLHLPIQRKAPNSLR